MRGQWGSFALHVLQEPRLRGQPTSQPFEAALPEGTWAQEGFSVTVKCPTSGVVHVTLARSLLAQTSHKSPSISKGVREYNDTIFLEEKEQEIFGKACHMAAWSKCENELRESASHGAWHIEGTPQTVVGSWSLRERQRWNSFHVQSLAQWLKGIPLTDWTVIN